ncbi:amino acid adenylation domain-containing protein [Antrihabitans sp. NCIMB 15449]|uniref:Amino acid adenylation domain-containing protein n=1 Tax=Antrihabitans spumae TaxID=3373370 RepID=A0ABW7JNZ6_9NOCA
MTLEPGAASAHHTPTPPTEGPRRRETAGGRRPRPVRRGRTRTVTLPQLLAAAVEIDPAAIALSLAGRDLSYAELDRWSSRVARVLIARGVGPENLVAIGIPRSIECVVAVWAVAKSGAGFVPVDPNYPAERVAHMVEDSRVRVGVTVEASLDSLPAGVGWLVLDDPALEAELATVSAEAVSYSDRLAPLRAEHPAYVIYTSGSTGKPKGVTVTQAGLATFCEEQRERYGVTAADRTLHFASPSFDASMLELLLAVGAGATMIIVPTDVYGGTELADLLRRERVTHAFVTPAALASVDPTGLDDLRVVIAGGEACPPELVARWSVPIGAEATPAQATPAHATQRAFHNGYGPTETTIMSNISSPLRPGEAITIGSAIREMRASVLDARLHPVPVGVAGEMYLSGVQLARGYHARPGLTAQRFVANPFGDPGDRLYRTGDIVRQTESGELEHLGRNDHQVKVRGFRIELGEIDTALTAHPSVQFAVTRAWAQQDRTDSAVGATILASYVLASDGAEVDPAKLADFVARTLPAHMVPAAIVVLDSIPLTPVGKLDRTALPRPAFEQRRYRAPQSPLEELVATIFGQVLGSDRVGRDDDFFELGGNSLNATQVATRLGSALGTSIPARVLFEAPTVTAMAAAVAPLKSGGTPQLTARTRPDRLPLSYAQQRYWFLNQFDTASAVDNIPIALRITGQLDIAAFRAAVADVVARHESLRTYYPGDDSGPYQVIVPAAEAVPTIEVEDVPEAELTARLLAVAAHSFDVSMHIPLQVNVFRVGADHVAAFVVHHIAADGSSIAPFANDLAVAYAFRAQDTAPQWTPLSIQYADYALWQRDALGADDDPDSLTTRQIEYWKSALADLPQQLDLPSDRPRGTRQSFRGAAVRFSLDDGLHRQLLTLAKGSGATLFMVMHSAFAVLLARMSGVDDVAVGTPIAGRGEEALDELIGMFVNTLVLRTVVDGGESFDDLLARVRETDLQAYAHADVPFERLVEALKPPRSTNRNPLYQIGFSFQNFAVKSVELPGLAVAPIDLDAHLAKTDLQLTVADLHDAAGEPTSIELEFSYATDLFDESTVVEFGERYRRILAAVVADAGAPVGHIDLMDDTERHRSLVEWNSTERATDRSATLVTLLDAQVAATPNAVAVVVDTVDAQPETLTYSELDRKVNRLARYLIEIGVGPESTVGLALGRGEELIVAMYAVTKAGGAYVPLATDQPRQRIDYQLATVEPVCVLTTAADDFAPPTGIRTVVLDELDTSTYADGPVLDVERIGALTPESLAYVVFTSGSTGRPKGVAITHGAIVNQLQWKRAEYELDSSDAILVKTAATFDLSVWEYWSATTSGGRMVLAARGMQRDPSYVNAVIDRHHVTVLHAVPTMLDALLIDSDGLLPASQRNVLVIGETMPAALAQRFRARNDGTLVNLYGPTEAAVSVTSHIVSDTDDTAVPIGAPEWNTQVFVLDSRLNPVPAGVAGELYLGGSQLARGYYGRPFLTAERYVANPYGPAGSRLYRTGDVVSWSSAGELEYVGRSDCQVKVHGFRIELGEIEQTLLRLNDIAQVAVVTHHTERSGAQLIGYVVPTAGSSIEASGLRSRLARELPPHMVPSASVILDELPLTAHGKLDRNALPAPGVQTTPYRAPQTLVEQTVAAVFAELLEREQVGLDDDFFELGGHSLLAAQAHRRLSRALGTEVALQWFFSHRTVGDLAARVCDWQGADDDAAMLRVVVPLGQPSNRPPLFCIHPISGLAWAYAGLVPYVGRTHQVYGLQSPAILEASASTTSIDALAARYVTEIRRIQPRGPYQLMGWSLGGVIAHAIAAKLQAAGAEVASLTLVDSVRETDPDVVRADVTATARQFGVTLDQAKTEVEELGGLESGQVRRLLSSALDSAVAMAHHRPARFDGDVTFFSAARDHPNAADAAATWQPYVAGRITNIDVPVRHGEMMTPAALEVLGPVLADALTAAVAAQRVVV